MTANPLKIAVAPRVMELDLEQARRWHASAVHYGYRDAAKAWAEYIVQIERKAA